MKTCAFCVLCSLFFISPVAAQDAATAAGIALRTSVKLTGLVFRAPDATQSSVKRTGAESLLRIRIEPSIRAGADATVTFAYEQQLRVASSALAVAGASILPSHSAAPYRVRQLSWASAEADGLKWLHEIDRASAQFNVRQAKLTVGRQGVGWGRGVMFGAVDLFSPFTPLEVDREWRRGVDAVRADIKLADRSSVDLVGAFGHDWNRSAVAARLRGYAKRADFELMVGRRGRDLFGGLSASAAIAGAEVHGELAAFRVPREDWLDAGRTVAKVVVGASYRLPVGSGILAYAEYHYSGFGAAHPREISARLSNSAYVERYVRGDTQILSKHALAVIGSYELSPEISYSGQWLHNPRDDSGVLVPGLTLTWSDALSMASSVYLPYGAKPAGGILRSEYGGASIAGLVQLRLYL